MSANETTTRRNHRSSSKQSTENQQPQTPLQTEDQLPQALVDEQPQVPAAVATLELTAAELAAAELAAAEIEDMLGQHPEETIFLGGETEGGEEEETETEDEKDDPFDLVDYAQLSLDTLLDIVIHDPRDLDAQDEIKQRIEKRHLSIWNRIKLDLKNAYDSDVKRSLVLYGLKTTMSTMLRDRRQIEKHLRQHQVFDAPHFGPLSDMDLVAMMEGRINPENPSAARIRGMQAISMLFPKEYATVEGGPRGYHLSYDGEDILLTAEELRGLLAQRDPKSHQEVPYTSRCILYRDRKVMDPQNSKLVYDGVTMILNPGATVTETGTGRVITFAGGIRLSLHYDIYNWIAIPFWVPGALKKGKVVTENQILMQKISFKFLKDEHGKPRLPKHLLEIEWLKCLYIYAKRDERGRKLLQQAGGMIAGMSEHTLKHYDLWLPAWKLIQQDREEGARKRQGARDAQRSDRQQPAKTVKQASNTDEFDPFDVETEEED